MILFSLAILLALWLMQIVFINVFYQSMKTGSIKNAASQIASVYGDIQGQALQTKLDTIANESDLSVNITDEGGNNLYSVNPVNSNYMKPAENMEPPPGGFGNPSGYGAQSNSADLGIQQANAVQAFAAQVLAQPGGELMQPFDDTRGMRMLLYGKVVQSPQGEKAVLVISSPLQPLTETVRILSRQLVYISLAILALALIVSVVIALMISRPLRRITEKAGELAKGRYDLQFAHGGYSEVNQLADTLNYATGELQQVENVRRELIANVSHDLRTPLTMIKLYAEMIRDLNGENRKKREQNVAVIIEESDRLTSLVQNLLDLSLLQSGAMPYEPSAFDLDGTIRRILPRYEALAQKEGYKFIYKTRGGVPVCADEPRIEQVLYNLINNAVNYAGEDKQILLDVESRGGTVRVSVEDHGEGIDPEKLNLIWDRYYKVDKEHRRSMTGSGLGLSIVKTIMDLHGMKYGVSSAPGCGATFWFELEKA
jgi:signal transduction histidine kinase